MGELYEIRGKDPDLLKRTCLEILNGQEGSVVLFALSGSKWVVCWSEVEQTTLLLGILERIKMDLMQGS